MATESSIPIYFRACVLEARTSRIGYAHAGWHLAIHLDDHVEPEALEELGTALISDDSEGATRKWFEKALPGCTELVPRRRWNTFLKGIELAVEQGRLTP